MPIESEADRAAFLADDGVTVAWAPAEGAPAELTALFFDADIEAFGASGVLSDAPRLLCRPADLPAGAAPGDAVTIGAGMFTVRVLRPDGTGMTLVQLEEA